jgi:hypothetical protein
VLLVFFETMRWSSDLSRMIFLALAFTQVSPTVSSQHQEELRKVDSEVLKDLMAKWAPRGWQDALSAEVEPCSWPGIVCGTTIESSMLFGSRTVKYVHISRIVELAEIPFPKKTNSSLLVHARYARTTQPCLQRQSHYLYLSHGLHRIGCAGTCFLAWMFMCFTT